MYIGQEKTISWEDMMKQMRIQGFQGANIFPMITPRPEDVDRVPSPPPANMGYQHFGEGVETSFASFYQTKCAYCWAIVRGKERERGFKLSEICQAARNGCSTCNVLQLGITKFANLLLPKYNYEKARIRQEYNKRLQLLSEAKSVTVSFDEYGGEMIGLVFDGSSKFQDS
jgi:hypothetical protein